MQTPLKFSEGERNTVTYLYFSLTDHVSDFFLTFIRLTTSTVKPAFCALRSVHEISIKLTRRRRRRYKRYKQECTAEIFVFRFV